ncbi:hypothetical protein ACHAW5_000023 [Stephanodiscus triporus]|uniref:Sulfotransferase domain-containing protein n=1 Tax=Stephanodiscus triporus TaxID=2934178 RepID=A0ABD3QZU8_9STRA
MINAVKRRWQWFFSAIAATSILSSLRNSMSLARSSFYDNNDPESSPPSCFRAREDSVPRLMRGTSYLNPPVINLGMPKIGSTSLQHFFACAGYGASHWWCGRGTHCARCIQDSVKHGLPPFQKCKGSGPMYSQIDGSGMGGKMYFPQVELLDEIVRAYPNATFFLTFRSMDGWYRSISKWKPNKINKNMKSLKDRMAGANITGLPVGSDGLESFADFFCNHVRRVREVVPRDRLVEIDIEDQRRTGPLLSDIFDIDEECWIQTNANPKLLRNNATGENGDRLSETLRTNVISDTVRGKAKIRGKGGVMRKNPTYDASIEASLLQKKKKTAQKLRSG